MPHLIANLVKQGLACNEKKNCSKVFYAWLKPTRLSITIKLSSFCSSLECLPLTLLNSTQPPAAMILLVSSFKRQKDNLSVKVLLYWGAWCYHNLYCHWHCYILFQGWLFKPAKRREFCDVIGYQAGNIADPKIACTWFTFFIISGKPSQPAA